MGEISQPRRHRLAIESASNRSARLLSASRLHGSPRRRTPSAKLNHQPLTTNHELIARLNLAISLTGVTKTFGSTIAVDNLDLEMPMGALYGFIGPNGAGKTTTLRMIMSILFPDRGELSVLGRPAAIEAKDRIGYLPEERGVYRKMKVGAFLIYMARLKGVRDFSPRASGSVARAAEPWRRAGQEMRGAVERHAAESAAHRCRPARAGPADPRRAVQRPRSGEHAIAARADPCRAPQGSDDHLFDARDGAG